MSKTSARQQKTQTTGPAALSDSGRLRAGVQDRRTASQPVATRPDRRVQRTQRTLREALIRLILERGWDGVSVQDICERADVGRSTFYVHFADKEELLVSGFGDLRKMLRAHLSPASGEPLGFTIALIEHAREYEPLFKALVGRRTALAVQRSFMDVVTELVEEDLVHGGAPPSPVREVAVSYVAGAFWEILRWWFEQRKPLPAAEIGGMFKRLTMPVLREVRRSEKDLA
jgi:AcrR family transcriptional regulator